MPSSLPPSLSPSFAPPVPACDPLSLVRVCQDETHAWGEGKRQRRIRMVMGFLWDTCPAHANCCGIRACLRRSMQSQPENNMVVTDPNTRTVAWPTQTQPASAPHIMMAWRLRRRQKGCYQEPGIGGVMKFSPNDGDEDNGWLQRAVRTGHHVARS